MVLQMCTHDFIQTYNNTHDLWCHTHDLYYCINDVTLMSHSWFVMSHCWGVMSHWWGVMTRMRCDVTLLGCDVTLLRCDVTLMRCGATLMRCDVTLMRCDVTLAGARCHKQIMIHILNFVKTCGLIQTMTDNSLLIHSILTSWNWYLLKYILLITHYSDRKRMLWS